MSSLADTSRFLQWSTLGAYMEQLEAVAKQGIKPGSHSS